ncbi:MAG: DUF5110 domain-containing protein [Phycisphaerae bacterium]|nr:DUF5110 domain-containing protein [Phycisphaerae bacterium]
MLRLLLPVVVLAVTSRGSLGMDKELNPMANPAAIVVSGNARFTVLTSALIRMEWAPTGSLEDRASLVFVNRRLMVPGFEVVRDGGWLSIRTDRLTLRYKQGSGPFRGDNLSVRLTLNGKPIVWTPGMENPGNLKGTYRTLDCVSGSISLPPGLLSRDGWVVVDDSRRLLFEDRAEAPWPWATPRAGKQAIDWYFFGYGHDYGQALRDFTRVAGRIPLPPQFTFGAWWSRYWAYSDAELKELVQEFDQNDVPLDVLVIDMDWHLDGWTGYTWNPKHFPDPEGFLRWVHEQGLRVTLNLHPADGVKKHEKAFAGMARAMGLNPETADHIPFDCTDPGYVTAYFDHLHHPLEREGVDFWWIDWQQGEKTRFEGLDPLWWLNYLHWTDMEWNPARNGKRPIMFSRWGGLGNHRYQIGFSGDTYCNWVSLAYQPYFTATAGNVCYPYWSHDIGGHQPGPVDPELYARWIQWGIFSPILRTHTTKNPKAERRIWKFPDEVFQAARQAFQLRHALIPYIYTAARQCYDTALPLCRPLYYEWPELGEAYTHPNEYLFGDDLLVAPVARSIDQISGCAEVRVWLPPGKWTNWFTGRTYTGPDQILLSVPLDEIPLFAREGAIIPAQPKMKRVNEKPADPLILHIWPGESGSTRVYEDDNETTSYQHGACTWTPIAHKLVDDLRYVTIDPVEGSFDGMLVERRYEVRLRDVWPAAEVALNGTMLRKAAGPADPGWWYDVQTLSVVIRLPRLPVNRRAEICVTPCLSLAAGLRGQLNRLAEVTKMLPADAPIRLNELTELRRRLAAGKLSPQEMSDSIHHYGKRLLEAWKDSRVASAAVRRRALMRLLGVQCQVDVTVAGDGGNCISVSEAVVVSPAADVLGAASGRFELSAPPNWSISGPTTWSVARLRQDQPVSFAVTLTLDGPLQTTVLGWRFTLEADDLRLEVPGRQVLFPSINRWWVVGPFSAEFKTGLDQVFPPEQKIDLQATYKGVKDQKIGWRKVGREITPGADFTEEFFVRLNEVFSGHHHNAVCYALTYLHAPVDTDATLAFGTDDGVVIWLNGEEIHRHQVGRAYQSKQDRIPVRLKKGSNSLLLKISQWGGDWGFCVHVEDAEGQPLTSVKPISP